MALALVAGLSLVAAVPVAATPANYPQFITIDQPNVTTGEWSTAQKQSGTYSYHVVLPANASNAGIDLIHKNIYGAAGVGTLTLADITTLHFYESVINDGDTSNMGAGISLFFDMNADGDWDWTHDAQIVFESPGVSGDINGGFKLRDVDAGAYHGFEMGGGKIGDASCANLAYWQTTAYATKVVLWVSIDVGWGAYNNYEGYFDDITINSTTYEVEPAMIVDGTDAALPTIVDGASFYLHMTSPVVNSHPAAPDSLDVTLKVYDGVGLVSTADYTATETGQTTKEFWTAAIDTDDLGVRPGDKLQASGVSSFIQAVISFDKTYYDVNETMTISLEDDQWNTDATTAETVADIGTCTIEDGAGSKDISTGWTETGADTGVFTKSLKPSDNGFVVGDSMTVTYTNADTAPVGVTDTAAVLLKSASSTSFDKGTYAATAATATVTVTDPDKNASAGALDEILGNPVVVENLSTGSSVTIAKLTETGNNTGQFTGTVTFGTGTGKLAIHDGDQLKATYTDPSDPSDVSSATAAVGYTVFLYDEADVFVAKYTTIKAAIDKVNDLNKDDYTIVVKSGYAASDEAWPVTVDIGQTGLTIKAEDGATVILDPWLASDADGIFVINDGSVTLEGLTLKHSKTAADSDNLILVQGDGDSLTIKECTFDLTAGAADDTGISFADAAITGVVMDGCTFNVGATATAIDSTIAGAFNVDFDVKNCTFTGSSGTGLTINHSGGAATVDADVISNTFDGLARALVIAETTATTNVEVKWNTIKNSDLATVGAIEISNSATVSIEGNDIKDNAGYSVWVKTDDTNVDVVFNNISGNAKVLKNNDTVGAKLNATHNWWGHVTAPTTSDVSSLTYVDTTYYLTAPVKLTAEYVTGAGSVDAHLTTGVKVTENIAGATNYVGVAEYTGSPKAALSNASFYDVFLDTAAVAAGDTVTIFFYTEGLSGDSVAYFWNNLTGSWDECSNQGYNTYDNYIWVLAKDQTATVPTYPTIQELTGGMFAVSTVPAVWDPMVYDANGDGVIQKSEAVDAVWDYFDGIITKEQAIEVVWLYFG